MAAPSAGEKVAALPAQPTVEQNHDKLTMKLPIDAAEFIERGGFDRPFLAWGNKLHAYVIKKDDIDALWHEFMDALKLEVLAVRDDNPDAERYCCMLSLEVNGTRVDPEKWKAVNCPYSRRWSARFADHHAVSALTNDELLTAKVVLICELSRRPQLDEAMAEDWLRLRRSGAGADAEIECGDRRIAAHSAVLIARSPVIASQLAERWPQKEGPRAVVKAGQLVTAPAMERVLEFMYAGHLNPPLRFEEARLRSRDLRPFEQPGQADRPSCARRWWTFFMLLTTLP